jgi:hypothetical protein
MSDAQDEVIVSSRNAFPSSFSTKEKRDMKRKLAAAALAVTLTLAAAVGAGWKWGSHAARGHALHQHRVAGWTWDESAPQSDGA